MSLDVLRLAGDLEVLVNPRFSDFWREILVIPLRFCLDRFV